MLITNNRVDCFRNSRGQKNGIQKVDAVLTKTKERLYLIYVVCLSEIESFTHVKFHDFHFENEIIFGL